MAYDDIAVGGSALSTIFDSARFLRYRGGRKVGTNHRIPGSHGEWAPDDKPFSSSTIYLEVFCPADTDSAAQAALDTFEALFAVQGLATIAYTDPNKGAIQAHIELADEAIPTQNRFVYLYPLRNPKGVWEDQSATNAASAMPPSVTTGGNRPIDDMVFTLAGPGYIQHTDSLGEVNRLTIDAGAGAGTYVIDCTPGARSIQKAGADQDAYLTISNDWPVFSAGAAQTLASDVNVAVAWRNKHA